MSAVPDIQQRVSVRTIADPKTPFGRRLHFFAPLLDRVLGIDAIDRFCERHGLYGLPAERFAKDGLDALGVTINGGECIRDRLPEDGPVIVVGNHPHGGIEGLVMVNLLAALRPDVKVMANTALRVFAELDPYFLYVNPLQPRHPSNGRGLRESLRHLRNGGVLVMFPAGRTSFYQKDLGQIADAEWNRSVANLARRTGAKILPVRFTGQNSALFYRLGSIWYRFRLLMLARELMKMADKSVDIVVGRAFDSAALASLDEDALTELLQVKCAALQPPVANLTTHADEDRPLALAGARHEIEAEIDGLPPAQRVVEARGCVVGFGTRRQLPSLVQEIARERERTFRLLDEGSGEPIDTDQYDDHFDHLFCWDRQTRALVGAYRIGRRDVLATTSGSYLEQMFDFGTDFFANRAPALELGRSFVTPEFQRSRHALDLLWRGIGGYLRAYPAYGTLYGTVSLTRQYDPMSIAMICDVMIDPATDVRPREPIAALLPPEWHRFRRNRPIDLSLLNTLVTIREADGKGLPVLLRHYAALGAKFHAVGIDANFAATPGLLLSVDLATLPEAKRRRYIG
ncbi:MAG: GNAT family N-acyltransferase [Pseudomonadota bacterium]